MEFYRKKLYQFVSCCIVKKTNQLISLLTEGISPHSINSGLGFNHFYSFDYINDLYKNVKTNYFTHNLPLSGNDISLL